MGSVSTLKRNTGIREEQNALRLKIMGSDVDTLLAKSVLPDRVRLTLNGPAIILVEYPTGQHPAAISLDLLLDIHEASLPVRPWARLASNREDSVGIDRRRELLQYLGPLLDDSEADRCLKNALVVRIHIERFCDGGREVEVI